MIRINGIVGDGRSGILHQALHGLEHRGLVERIFVPEADIGRRRLRVVTDKGNECAIALPREDTLFDGAVLSIRDDGAIVVRAGATRRLRLRPVDREAALALGFAAGNLHWRVQFEGGDLLVLLDGPDADYLARIRPLLEQSAVLRIDDAC